MGIVGGYLVVIIQDGISVYRREIPPCDAGIARRRALQLLKEHMDSRQGRKGETHSASVYGPTGEKLFIL